MFRWLQRPGLYLFNIADTGFNKVFTPRFNPLYYLGGLAFYFFWIVAASGLYLYIFFETSIVNAYASVDYLTHEQWYLGGVMRSLHRYASDAMVIVVVIHLLREFVQDRFSGARWFSWFSGVPLIWLIYASGIGGYWLVWDQMAQVIAMLTAEWLDWLPIFAEPMARNFMNEASLSDRFFSLLAFLHIGIPLALLLGMWIHIQRVSRPRSNPPRILMAGVLLALLVLSFYKPALSHAPANLDATVVAVDLDWFYLFIYPLLETSSATVIWLGATGATLLLMIMPWLTFKRQTPVAVVNLDNCNGCGQCFDDCPYSAVDIRPRTDGLPFSNEAVVSNSMCVSCGICVGACPTATPFRRRTRLVPGIEMPDAPLAELREVIIQKTSALEGDARVLLVVCQPAPVHQFSEGNDVATIQVPCIAALPPSFLDFVISHHYVDGVFLQGCRDGQCFHRFGTDWTEQRIAGQRDPRLRKRIPAERIAMSWDEHWQGASLQHALQNYQEQLHSLGAYQRPMPADRKVSQEGAS